MRKNLNEQLKLVTFSLVLFAGAVSYGTSENNSDSKPVAVSSSSASPTMNQSAGSSNSQNNAAASLSKIIGAAHIGLGASQIAAGSSATPFGTALVMQGIINVGMGGLAFMQASANSGAAGSAAMTGLDTSAWNNPFGNPNMPSTANLLDPKVDITKDPTIAGHIDPKKLNDIKSQLLSTGIGGVRIDPKSGKIIDTKTGKSYDMKQMGSADQMEKAGFSGSDISAAMNSAGQIEKAAMKKLGLSAEGIGTATAENGTIDGGSAGVNGGAMSGGSADANGMSGGRRGIASSGGAGVKIPSNQIAGLSKNFNGERIGVSAENIFNMMARRYKTKEKQNSFFDPSELVKMPQ